MILIMMNTKATTPTSVTIARCAGTPHTECRAARRRVAGAKGPALLLVHAANPPRSRGVTVDLVMPASTPLTEIARQRLEGNFEVWLLASWVGASATAIIDAQGGRWTAVEPRVLGAFLEDLTRLANLHPAPPAPRRPAR